MGLFYSIFRLQSYKNIWSFHTYLNIFEYLCKHYEDMCILFC